METCWPLRVSGRGFNLGVDLTKPVATVTLWPCLVNTACAILSVFTSTHFVSCTIQCEETGFHFLSASVFGERLFTLLLDGLFVSHESSDGRLFVTLEGFYLMDLLVMLLLCFGLSDTWITQNLLAPKLYVTAKIMGPSFLYYLQYRTFLCVNYIY